MHNRFLWLQLFAEGTAGDGGDGSGDGAAASGVNSPDAAGQETRADRLRKLGQERDHLEKFAAEPFAISAEDWRREVYNAALRRVMADASIQESTKIAFRRHVQLGESAAEVAADLGLEVNALYQIKNRMKERIAAEVENLKNEFPDGL